MLVILSYTFLKWSLIFDKLIDKIRGDYYFIVNDNHDKALEYYKKYDEATKHSTILIFNEVILHYLKDLNNLKYLSKSDKNSKRKQAINRMYDCIKAIDKCYQEKNHLEIKSKCEKILNDYIMY